jgi:hypothetical protein
LIRTDTYPIKGTKDEEMRMKNADQVRPSAAREALRDGLLVFGLCPDMKWRRVKSVSVMPHGFRDRVIFNIVFTSGYARQFTKDGILLVEREGEDHDA